MLSADGRAGSANSYTFLSPMLREHFTSRCSAAASTRASSESAAQPGKRLRPAGRRGRGTHGAVEDDADLVVGRHLHPEAGRRQLSVCCANTFALMRCARACEAANFGDVAPHLLRMVSATKRSATCMYVGFLFAAVAGGLSTESSISGAFTASSNMWPEQSSRKIRYSFMALNCKNIWTSVSFPDLDSFQS